MLSQEQIERAQVKADQNLRQASDALQVMEQTDSYEEFAEKWETFLFSIDRVFNFLKVLGPVKPRIKRIVDKLSFDRKNDELLSYVMQARNVHEHGLQDSTSIEPFNLSIGVSSSAIIENVSVVHNPRGTEVNSKYIGGAHIESSGGGFILVKITNRGVDFEPPKKYQSQRLGSNRPILVAKLALEYYEEMSNRTKRGLKMP